ncbi:MAG: GH36 C-terminal domain-containing protein [Lachnospiraceae bacterium]|nr:GH36 C-terminal domain-containing protein [Lachnospiraceae bacterium]
MVAFAFHQGFAFDAPEPRLYLEGLDPEGLYAVEGMDGKLHGSTLMGAGLETGLWGDFDSRMFRIRLCEG